MEKVSIIIPVYNAEATLERCIHSIIDQSWQDWELILINDGSTDDSERYCRAIAAQDSRMVLLSQDNAGPSAARNAGLAIATGDFICFVDADDHVAPDYVEKLSIAMRQNKVEMAMCGYAEFSQFNPNGIQLHNLSSFSSKKVISRDQFASLLFTGLTGVLWGKMFLHEVIDRYQLRLDESLSLSEDLIFVLRYHQVIENIALVLDFLYFYDRRSEKGLSRKQDDLFLANVVRCNAAIERYYRGENVKEIIENRMAKAVLAAINSCAADRSIPVKARKSKIRKYYQQHIGYFQNFDSTGFDNRILSLLENNRLQEIIIINRLRSMYHQLRYK